MYKIVKTLDDMINVINEETKEYVFSESFDPNYCDVVLEYGEVDEVKAVTVTYNVENSQVEATYNLKGVLLVNIVNDFMVFEPTQEQLEEEQEYEKMGSVVYNYLKNKKENLDQQEEQALENEEEQSEVVIDNINSEVMNIINDLSEVYDDGAQVQLDEETMEKIVQCDTYLFMKKIIDDKLLIHINPKLVEIDYFNFLEGQANTTQKNSAYNLYCFSLEKGEMLFKSASKSIIDGEVQYKEFGDITKVSA